MVKMKSCEKYKIFPQRKNKQKASHIARDQTFAESLETENKKQDYQPLRPPHEQTEEQRNFWIYQVHNENRKKTEAWYPVGSRKMFSSE